MRVTNILSSHYPGSFIQVLLERFNETLDTLGHEHRTVDLYQSNFNPVMRGDDFNQFFEKPLPPEIEEFHDLLRETDVLALFYPIWWNDMPAILKGWVDRVFSKGFAYDVPPEGPNGLRSVRKVLLICTLGNKKEDIHEQLEEAMRVKECHGVFGYCGIRRVEHLFLYNVDGSDEIREQCIEKVKALALTL